jgi:hypothetical protein
MIPGLSMLTGGGLSMSDSTTVSFDPFADQRKSASNVINVKSGGFSVESVLPFVLIGAVVLLAWKLLK